MRQILILAAVLLVGGAYAARYADQAVSANPHPHIALADRSERPRQSSAGQHKMVLDSARDSHFHVDARVDGRSMEFIVDTGASLVILRESDAAKIGFRPSPRDYTATVSTANGAVRAAPTRLNRIEVGDITVWDVRALVLPDEALWQNLLGMSFLSQLRRYEYAEGRLLLEQ